MKTTPTSFHLFGATLKDLHEFKQRLRELNEDMERTGMNERFDTDFDSSPEDKGNGGVVV